MTTLAAAAALFSTSDAYLIILIVHLQQEFNLFLFYFFVMIDNETFEMHISFSDEVACTRMGMHTNEQSVFSRETIIQHFISYEFYARKQRDKNKISNNKTRRVFILSLSFFYFFCHFVINFMLLG